MWYSEWYSLGKALKRLKPREPKSEKIKDRFQMNMHMHKRDGQRPPLEEVLSTMPGHKRLVDPVCTKVEFNVCPGSDYAMIAQIRKKANHP